MGAWVGDGDGESATESVEVVLDTSAEDGSRDKESKDETSLEEGI
jgi:hypothetical protein